MPATRKQRLQEVLRDEISHVLQREMRDPKFAEGLISVTQVEATQDLKHATVYISMLGTQSPAEEILKALRGATGVVRGELMRRKAFKTVPELTFQHDDAMERGTRMFDVLERVRQEDAERVKTFGVPDNEPSEEAQ